MRSKVILTLAIACSALLFSQTAYLQSPTPTPFPSSPTPTSYSQTGTSTPSPTSTATPTPEQEQPQAGGPVKKTWLPNLVLLIILGAIGGLMNELIGNNGIVEIPHRAKPEDLEVNTATIKLAKYGYDLGVLARVSIGIVAAFLTYAVVKSETPLELFALSTVGGFAGTLVFTALQQRLTAILAQAELVRLKDDVQQMRTKREAALQQLSEVEKTLIQAASGINANQPAPESEIERIRSVIGKIRSIIGEIRQQ